MNGNQAQVEKYQEYLKNLISRLQGDGDEAAEGAELALGKKYLDSQLRLQQMLHEREELNKQLNAMQQRMQQVTAAVQEENGRAGGLAESLVALKFGEEGDSAPSRSNRKSRRAAFSNPKKGKSDA